PGFVDQRLADQVGTDVRLQRPAVKDLLDTVGLDGTAQAEFQGPAPLVGYQIAAKVAVALLHDGQESQIQGRVGCAEGHVLILVAVVHLSGLQADRHSNDSGKKVEGL